MPQQKSFNLVKGSFSGLHTYVHTQTSYIYYVLEKSCPSILLVGSFFRKLLNLVFYASVSMFI